MSEFEFISFAGAPMPVQRELSLAALTQQIHMEALRKRGNGTQVTRAYSAVAAVYACVKAKADAIALMPLMISTAEDQIVESGPLAELAERPNPKTTGRAFRRATSAFLDLFGRAHWVKVLSPGGRLRELHVVNPLQMEPRRDRITGDLVGWTYTAAGSLRGRKEELGLDVVHTILDPDFEDPQNPFEGLSPRRAAATAIGQYYKADMANDYSLDNGLEPGGVLETTQSLTDPQKRDIRETMADRHQGLRNRRRMLLLEGGLTFKPIAATFSDMEFAQLKAMSRTDICAAFSVPPAVIGYYEDSNYAHAESAERGFWIKTMLPRAAWIAEEWDIGVGAHFEGDRSLSLASGQTRELNKLERFCRCWRLARKAAKRSGRRYYAWFDSSTIPAVQRAQFEQAEAAKTWIDKGVPLNGVIRAFDLPFDEPEWGNTWYKPMGLVDVREDSMPWSDDPPGGEPAEPAPAGQDRQDNGGPGRQAGKGAKPADRRQRAGVDVRQPSSETLAGIWGAWRTSWSGLERSCRSKVKAHFYDLRQGVLDRLAKLPAEGLRSIEPERRRDIIATVLFDLQEANGLLVAKVRPLFRESYRLGGEQAMQEAADARGGKADPFNISDPGTLAKLRGREVKITEINVTLRRQIAQTLADGMEAGESMAQITERVKDTFNFASNRARMIARTEIGAAVEEARHEGRQQAGVPMKSWLWSRKETGRPGHMETEFQTMQSPLPNAQEFTLAQTGNHCQHPRGTGEPEDDINCACTTLGRFPGDNLKSVIDRYQRRGFLSYEQLAARDAKPAGSKEPPQ